MNKKHQKMFHCIPAVLFIFILAFIQVGMVSAEDIQSSFFTAEAKKVYERVCPGRKVTISYMLIFHGLDYEKDKLKEGKGPVLPSLTHPVVKLTSSSGRIVKIQDPGEGSEADDPTYDPVFKTWTGVFSYFPDKPGKVTINLEATYMGMVARDKWEFKVWEECSYKVEISANESGFKLPNNQTVNEAQSDIKIITFVKGLAKGLILVDDNGGGGQKRLVSNAHLVWPHDDAIGESNSFGDAIWLGKDPDMTCGTDGALTCERSFTVHPELSGDGMDLTISMQSGQCSGYSVWCKGKGGTGKASIPALKSIPFEMNVSLPLEGGSAHFVRKLPYGVTMDYLITVYPDRESE